MKKFDRRDFIKNSIGMAAGLSVLSAASRAYGANEKIIIGVIGIGGRGTYLAQEFLKKTNKPVIQMGCYCMGRSVIHNGVVLPVNG